MKAFAILGSSGRIYDFYNTQAEAENALDNLCVQQYNANRATHSQQAKPFSNTRVIATANIDIDECNYVTGASKLKTLYVCKRYWQN